MNLCKTLGAQPPRKAPPDAAQAARLVRKRGTNPFDPYNFVLIFRQVDVGTKKRRKFRGVFEFDKKFSGGGFPRIFTPYDGLIIVDGNARVSKRKLFV